MAKTKIHPFGYFTCVYCKKMFYKQHERNKPYKCENCKSKNKERMLKAQAAPHKENCKCAMCGGGRGLFGPNNAAWKGGRNKLKDGYIYTWISPEDP